MAAYCNRTSLDIKLVGIFLTEQLWLLCSGFQHSCIQSAGLALPVGWLPSQQDLNSSSLINLLHFLSQSIEPSTHLPSIPSEAFNMFNLSGAIPARNSLDAINFLSTALACTCYSCTKPLWQKTHTTHHKTIWISRCKDSIVELNKTKTLKEPYLHTWYTWH